MVIPNIEIAQKLIANQFPEYVHLPITEVEKQGHDNSSYRLGNDMIIRMPTAEDYALKIPIEQELLPKLQKYLTIQIPAPIKMGIPSEEYQYPFSIYKYLPGRSINLASLSEIEKEGLAYDLSNFLKELQNITAVKGPEPGLHNWWRGDHLSVYEKGAMGQIEELSSIINSKKALDLWNQAYDTKWDKDPVWIHGDVAIGNILIDNGKLSAVIDFGGMAVGDPACDLVIAWTYFNGKSRDIFIKNMEIDENTWLRAKAWALWKASYELCQMPDKNSIEADMQKKIINEVIN